MTSKSTVPPLAESLAPVQDRAGAEWGLLPLPSLPPGRFLSPPVSLRSVEAAAGGGGGGVMPVLIELPGDELPLDCV